MRGNNNQMRAEREQDRRFDALMDFPELRAVEKESGSGELKVSVFECLKARQPAAAWKMGWMAGWPEMRNA